MGNAMNPQFTQDVSAHLRLFNVGGMCFIMNLIEGQIYKVNHSRKGVFNLMVTNQDKTWVTGLIVEGKAGAILEYNEREQFEDITIRKELCKFRAVN